ncbi:unnamed protein product [Rotaria sp. Silwood1]|nr:unnamed protein product [Rotaria sp. Silwood1]CAF1184772.1 unnamed protein product [Rotaria sp. Silwood1]CAF3478621.1 unnamed protein product [Rotaria sp. Silwood1]CAF3492974.1 unnamed protein product [Rotaria sp. Silwood1]CAF4730481.1 unnamed protein product [Rotaria sp. Silwood1]
MTSCGRIILGFLIILTIGVFIIQIYFGMQYLYKPVACERSKFLTILTLAGGCSGILSVIFLSCCCHGLGFGLRSSNPDRNKRQIFY